MEFRELRVSTQHTLRLSRSLSLALSPSLSLSRPVQAVKISGAGRLGKNKAESVFPQAGSHHPWEEHVSI